MAVINWNAYTGKKIAEYFEAYKNYLYINDLDDDSDTITVENLINFVETEILGE